MTDQKIWKPQGNLAWLLTLTACLLAALLVWLGYCMACPAPWDGPGKLGAVALFLLTFVP